MCDEAVEYVHPGPPGLPAWAGLKPHVALVVDATLDSAQLAGLAPALLEVLEVGLAAPSHEDGGVCGQLRGRGWRQEAGQRGVGEWAHQWAQLSHIGSTMLGAHYGACLISPPPPSPPLPSPSFFASTNAGQQKHTIRSEWAWSS